MRTVHRWVAVLAVLFGLYYGSTGLFIQLIDQRALLSHAGASDPTMQAIRVGHDGPPNFQVIREPDYSAAALPGDFDFDAALPTVMQAGRAAVSNGPIAFLEFRMLNGRPVGQVASKGQLFGFDASTGAVLGVPSKVTLPPLSLPSFRNSVKDVHRLRTFGPWVMLVDLIAALALLVMIVTGLVVYFRLWRARARMKRAALYWSAGGWWRSLHRFVGLIAALFLIIVAISGGILASSSIGVNISAAIRGGARPGLTADVASPLVDGELAPLLHTTLSAYRSTTRDAAVKVIRLRHFAGMPQGVVITGGAETTQLVFNAISGRAVSESEPGYPDTGMPFGWQVTQIAKQVHRGDFIGVSGRWMSIFAGLSLLYLTISGVVMYFELWNRRRQRGSSGLFWS
jgi:uncharacterized iron-regulated membrane protein